MIEIEGILVRFDSDPHFRQIKMMLTKYDQDIQYSRVYVFEPKTFVGLIASILRAYQDFKQNSDSYSVPTGCEVPHRLEY